jgi:hypothetical protein
VAFPDILDLVRDHLATAHSPTPVLTRVPDPRPAAFIQVRLVGGTDLRPVRTRERLDVFTWSTDEPAAQALGLAVRATLHALAGTATLGPMCYRVDEFLSPRPFDDLTAGAFRSWATYQLDVRADDAIAP